MKVTPFHGALRRLTLGVAALGLVVGLAACDGEDATGPIATDRTVAEYIVQEAELNDLQLIAEAARIVDIEGETFTGELAGSGPYTLFAFVNAATNNYEIISGDSLLGDPDAASAVISYHIVAGQEVTDLEAGSSLTTVGGGVIDIVEVGGTLTANGAEIERSVEASDGVIHVIERPLFPNVPLQVTYTEAASELQAALSTAGLVDDLSAEGPFTVFVPSDAAFAGVQGVGADSLLGEDFLADVLNFHVVQGALYSDEFEDGQTITTVQGEELVVSVEDGVVFVSGAAVTSADIGTGNGVVHIVDDVLLQSLTLGERVRYSDELTSLNAELTTAGLIDDLEGEGPFTVFAPINDALAGIETGVFDDIDGLREEVLSYHVVPDRELTASEFTDGMTLPTLEGEELMVTVVDGEVFVDGAAVVVPNVQVANGVVHFIDMALLGGASAAERIALTPGLSTLEDAVAEADLFGMLDGDGPFTVFAPSDAAFSQIEVDSLTGDADLLTEILTYHVVPGTFTAADLMDGQTLETVEGDVLDVSVVEGAVYVNGNAVSTVDGFTDNGVLHVIGGVLTETASIAEQAFITPSLQPLYDFLVRTDLVDALDGDGPFTVFAPTDGAFDGIDATPFDTTGGVDGDLELLAEVLTYHVVPGSAVYTDEFTEGMTFETLEGGTATVTTVNASQGTYIIDNEATLPVRDIRAENGVIHLAGDVLLGGTSIADRVFLTPELATLYDALSEVELVEMLEEDGPFTLFAPATADTLAALLDQRVPDVEAIENILLTHVLEGVTTAGEITDGLEVEAVSGDTLTFTVGDDGIIVSATGDDGTPITSPNLPSENGIVHIINDVLLPAEGGDDDGDSAVTRRRF